jgi:hypothetical protein
MGLEMTVNKVSRKEEDKMKGLFKRFETLMMAVSFAEEGEFETARQLMKEDEKRKTDRPSIPQRPIQRKTLRAD